MTEHLKENLTSEQCIVCYTDTTNRTICCSAAICTECYLEWLKIKRQCMHCKQDQCDFNIWFEQYRVEPEFDPLDILHELTQDTENSTSFSLEDMLNFIFPLRVQVPYFKWKNPVLLGTPLPCPNFA